MQLQKLHLSRCRFMKLKRLVSLRSSVFSVRFLHNFAVLHYNVRCWISCIQVEGLYKSLLQELAQKRGSRCPTYETDRSGPPHMPMFVSKVEIGGESFEGQQAKSKKVAEMNAAKAAYSALIGRK